jgi:Flp pilus assembly protein TadB
MSAPPTPPSDPGASSRARAHYANPGMRVSDAERAEVADRLSKHYGDGRLDQGEFDKRLHQAMSAVTQADLHGLFADLPDADLPDAEPASQQSADARSPGTARPAAAPTAARRRPRRQLHRLLPLLVLVVIAAVVGHAMSQLFFPWLLIGVAAVVWLRFGHRRRL